VGWLDDVLHIAMEFIEGASLAKLMQDQGRIAWKHALDFGHQVAAALSRAHQTGIIHRDVKLTNILIDPHGRAYVTDFGIAKVVTADTQLTVQGERLGTPQYMAPERFSGGEVTPSSDLYSLGVVLFQLISGRLPYEAGSQVGLIKKIASDPPARLREFVPSVPEDVERLVAYLIEKRPKNRPKSAEEVCEAIARVRAGKPLDEGPSYAPSALAEFRDSLAKVRRGPATPPPRQKTPTSGRLFAATTRWTQKWAKVPRWIRVGMLVGGLVLATAYPAMLTLFHFTGEPALAAVARANGEVERWSQSPAVADFAEQSPDEITARLHLTDFAVSRGAWVGNRLVVELRGVDESPRQGQYAVCTIQPADETAYLTAPPFRGDATGAWAAATWTPASSWMQEYAAYLADSEVPVVETALSQSGQCFAYIRKSRGEGGELWTVFREGAGFRQTLLAEEALSLAPTAIAPDGKTLVAGIADSQGQSRVRLIDINDGQTVAELGDGREAQWLPSGEGLLVSASDEKGACQLWAIQADNLGSRVRLTYFENGCAPRFFLSEDGAWAAVARQAKGRPQISFIRTASSD
jgi:hypothetical protein